ncbi:thioredoxin-like protein [Elsinoe ampelina]|uniref:Thioredoxin-like protein n=1 Tax=Elsinoe ampelina TaxID=302913 RepID=A0A6A6G441_9PEZI|nr:thioredoxin-like protein [Elsinoe ampelina]
MHHLLRQSSRQIPRPLHLTRSITTLVHQPHRPSLPSPTPNHSHPTTLPSQSHPSSPPATPQRTISFLARLFGSFSGPSPEQKMAAKQKAQSIIDKGGVAVFSKSYCPYCKATKELLSRVGAKYEVLELDQIDDGAAIQDALQEITNQRSVPNIFIAKEHIGGNSDIQALGEGKLKSKLTSAGAL